MHFGLPAELKLPGLHGEQLEARNTSEKVPGAQERHSRPRLSIKVPGPQYLVGFEVGREEGLDEGVPVGG